MLARGSDMVEKLDRQTVERELAALRDWSLAENGDAIERSFTFADFKEAFSFMTRAALKAEAMNHHPEWFNVYKTVNVKLTTHDAKGVTERDLVLARYMDQVAR